MRDFLQKPNAINNKKIAHLYPIVCYIFIEFWVPITPTLLKKSY